MMSISDQKKTLEAGFLAVAQNNVQVVHVTDSKCFDPDTAYIPFASIEEGISHSNKPCSKCCPSDSRQTATERKSVN